MLNIRENNGEDSPALDEYITGIQAQILEEVERFLNRLTSGMLLFIGVNWEFVPVGVC